MLGVGGKKVLQLAMVNTIHGIEGKNNHLYWIWYLQKSQRYHSPMGKSVHVVLEIELEDHKILKCIEGYK
ncbi:hypothetical protein E2C01_050548 [Portunus trituberculatus]|uniref:Uncharacterized protein n=1 Tax=Portunus trituberculatus TaxID=210409 RepID=A0A5B7GJ97_PORTR|nr:hypothetical protein [Portunus trituberculatus]